jgi:Coenzyme PQQ synthesis protein D (PqqD)
MNSRERGFSVQRPDGEWQTFALEETWMAEMLPRPVPGVIVQQQEEAWFLLDTEAGEVFNINSTAATIFSLCQSGTTLEGAVQSITTRFNAPGHEADIREDVLTTVRTFQDLGLCEPPAK